MPSLNSVGRKDGALLRHGYQFDADAGLQRRGEAAISDKMAGRRLALILVRAAEIGSQAQLGRKAFGGWVGGYYQAIRTCSQEECIGDCAIGGLRQPESYPGCLCGDHVAIAL